MANDAYGYEAAAEVEAMHRALHPKMRSWYATRPDLVEVHGAYPTFWRDFSTWAPFKQVQREYMRWLDRKERGLPAEPVPPTTTATQPPPPQPPAPGVAMETETTAAPAPSPMAAAAPAEAAPLAGRKRRRWEDAAAATIHATVGMAATSVPSADGVGDNGPAAPPLPVKRRPVRWSATELPPPMTLPTTRLRSRFGRRIMPAFNTVMPGDTPVAQEALFLYRVRLEEVAAKMMLLPVEVARITADPNRSPSPEPEYDTTGKRVNSREQRMRAALLAERDAILERYMDLNPSSCGAAGPKFIRKVYIPWREHPDVNYMGILIGPRGNTQKRLEKETNCRIAVRGKGVGKEAKLKAEGEEGEEEEMHVAVIGSRLSEVLSAVKLIEDLISKPLEPDNNEFAKLQMIELLAYNGQLSRLNEPCTVCGEQGHKNYDCPYRDANVKRANVRCALCGDASHVTADCKLARRGAAAADGDGDGIVVDEKDAEFMQYLAELSGKPAAPKVGVAVPAGTGRGGSSSEVARPATAGAPAPPPSATPLPSLPPVGGGVVAPRPAPTTEASPPGVNPTPPPSTTAPVTPAIRPGGGTWHGMARPMAPTGGGWAGAMPSGVGGYGAPTMVGMGMGGGYAMGMAAPGMMGYGGMAAPAGMMMGGYGGMAGPGFGMVPYPPSMGMGMAGMMGGMAPGMVPPPPPPPPPPPAPGT